MPFFLDEKGDLVGPSLPDHISLDLFEAPNPFGEATTEERLEVLAQISSGAKSRLDESLQSLLALIRVCNPVGLLSHFAFYDLTFPYSEKSEYEPAQQHQVELLQALILTLKVAELSRNPPSPDQRLEAKRLTDEVAHAFMMHRISPDKVTPTDLLREQVRAATQTIRNPGYSDQIEKNLRDLFSPLDDDLFKLRGVTFSGLISLWKSFSQRVQIRYNAVFQVFKKLKRQRTIKGVLATFQAETGVDPDLIDEFRKRAKEEKRSIKEVIAGLWNFSESTHPGIFIATLDDLLEDYPGNVDRSRLAEAVSRWSSKFGDFHGQNVEHLFLDNPIWRKPIIELSDQTYFWPVIGSFISFGMEMLEEQLIDNERLKRRYHERRAEFLETMVVDIVKRAIPGGTVYPNLVWFDPKEGETDVLVLVDRHALILECKSGRIPPSARRGGGSLNQKIKELIQEPTDQGSRFMRLLLESKTPLQVSDGFGVTHEIPRAKIRRVTRVNVLLDFFGTLACEYKLMSAAGLLSTKARPAVTMSLVDLENITWLLESPLQILHYLHRRMQFEERTQVMGDEMDWLACYLAGMFDRWPLEEKLKLQLFLCSEQLDPYFMRRSLSVPKKVPKLRLSPWWSAILSRLEERKCEAWTEMGMILLSFPYHQQGEYREFVDKVASDMRIDPRLAEGSEMIYGYCTQGGE
jgi:hypothetical protein